MTGPMLEPGVSIEERILRWQRLYDAELRKSGINTKTQNISDKIDELKKSATEPATEPATSPLVSGVVTTSPSVPFQERYKAIAKELNERITRREIADLTAEQLQEFKDDNERLAALGEPLKLLPEVEEVEITWEDVRTWAAETSDHAAKTLISMGWEDSDRFRAEIADEVLSGLVLPTEEDDAGNITVIEDWKDTTRFESNIINLMMADNPGRAIILNQLVEANERAFAFPAEITKEQQLRAISQSMENNGNVSNGFNNAVRGIGAFTAEDELAAAQWESSLDVVNDEGRTVLQEHLRAASGPVTNRDDLAGTLQSESARLLRGKSDWELRESDSIFGNFGMPADIGVTGTQAIQDRLQRDTAGFITEASIKAAIRESLGAAGIPFREGDFPDTEEGKKDFKAAKRIYDQFVNSILDGVTASREGLDDMQLASAIATYIEQGTDQFVEATTVQRQNNDIEAERVQAVKDAAEAAQDAKDAAEALANLAGDKSASDEALKDAIHEADPTADISRLLPDDVDRFRRDIQRGIPPTTLGVQSATERFERDEQAKEDAEAAADAAAAQAELDRVEAAEAVAAGRFAISDGEILRALEEAEIGNVGDTGDYQQFLRSLIPEIRDNLESVRRLDPTATLDVKALLTGRGPEDIGVTGQFDTGIEGILSDIEGFQTEEEFTAEKLRVASPDDALRIRQDLDKIQEEERLRDESRLPQLSVPFQTDDDPNIFGDEQIGADLLPPGVPGLPTLDDTGVISSSALDAQREKALQLEIPDFGEIQDLVANLSGGNPELQRFIFENLDLDAIKKTGRDEAARRRQEAFEHAARLSETPEPFVMPDISRLSPDQIARLEAQREQRSKTPVLTGPQSARFADRPLPKVKFAPLVEEQLPELTRRFEESPAQVAIRQREIEAEEQEKKREAEAEDVRRQSRALRRGRTVFSRG